MYAFKCNVTSEKTIVWLQLHILCNLMKCWSPLCNIYIYITKFNKYFFKNICVNQPMQYFETIVIFWLLGWFKYRRQKAQLVEYLRRDSGFESQSGPSLFIPSRYCLCRDNPWNWQVKSCQGKEAGGNLQEQRAFKVKESDGQTVLNICNR